MSLKCRFEPVTARGSSLSLRQPDQLRSEGQLYLDQLTLDRLLAAEVNDSLRLIPDDRIAAPNVSAGPKRSFERRRPE